MTRLLVASADEAAHRQLGQWLCRAGDELISVSSASDALLTLMTREVDLAFLDLDLQELSGPKAVQLMRQCRPRLPVVVLASELAPGSLGRIRGAGVFFTLLKPLDRAEVEEVAASALRRRGGARGAGPRPA